MKKIKSIIVMSSFVLMFMVCLVSCKKKIVFVVNDNNITINALETHKINITMKNVNANDIHYQISNNSIIEIKDNVIYGKNIGMCDVTVSYKDISFNIKVTVQEGYQELILSKGSTYQIESNGIADIYFITFDNKIIELSESGLIKCIELGEAKVRVHSKEDSKLIKIIDVIVDVPIVEKIESIDSLTLNINDEYQLEWVVLPQYCYDEVSIVSSNNNVVEVSSDGQIKAKVPGNAIISIISCANNNISKNINVEVKGEIASSIEVCDNIKINLGEIVNLNYEVTPSGAYQYLDYYISDDSALEFDGTNLTAKKVGEYKIILKTIDGSNLEKEINVTVNSIEDGPIFVYDDTFELEQELNWNTEFDPLKGIRAYDPIEGELTENILVDNPVNNRLRGTYKVVYYISNSKGETVTLERTVNVVWNHDVTFVGHGGSYYGAFNSEEAILYAARDLNYQAIEIDLKQTKDGVFVLSHDSNFGEYNLEDYTWSFLKDKEVTTIRKNGLAGATVKGDGKYTAKLCTLERYLEICKEYGVIAVIELKTSTGISNWTELNNSKNSKMPELMKIIEKVGMEKNVILLSNQYMCLAWTRNNGYEYIPCQYLVSSCENQDYLDTCIKYNLDISMNVRDNTINSDAWIQKYRDAGCKIAVYTFEEYASYNDVQKWIDKGVDYITTDWHDMSKFKYPDNSD